MVNLPTWARKYPMSSDTVSAIAALAILIGIVMIVFGLIRALIGYATRPRCARCGMPFVWVTGRRIYRPCQCSPKRELDNDGYDV